MLFSHRFAWSPGHDFMSMLVCVCSTWGWQKCCCVSAGVRGAPQPRAERLRSRLDHCHQSPGGNPNLSAVSCATLEGKHMNTDRFFNSHNGSFFWTFFTDTRGSCHKLDCSGPAAPCLTLVRRQYSIQLCKAAGERGGGWGRGSLWTLNNHEKDKSQAGQ